MCAAFDVCAPAISAYWSKHLIGRSYDAVEITLGYPRRDDATRRLSFQWEGFSVCSILHPEFGAAPVTVFKIALLVPAD